MNSLYERIGGTDMVAAIVDKFYDKVVADDRLKHFFEDTDLTNLRSHQKLFIMYIFGGADSYAGKSVRNAHKNLVDNMRLSNEHFDAMIQNLEATLTELDVPGDLITEAIEITQSLRVNILNR